MIENSIKELTLEEETTNIAKYRKSAIDYLAKNTEIKGFRKGIKIPENVIVKHYWEEHINNMTIDRAIDELYKKALKKESIFPVGQAEIKEIVSQNPLKVIIHVEVFPEIEIDKKYKKIKLPKTEVKVSAAEVNDAISQIEKKFTKFEPIDKKTYKAKMWDKVYIDTDGFDKDWNLLETTSMKNYPIILGSGILVPWFEEWIVWATIGSELKLDIKFPKDYHNKDFAWKEVKFEINVNAIEKAVKPEFTPEFIEQLRGKKLEFADFKKLIKSEILENKLQNARLEDENKLIDELLKITKLDLGKSMLGNQIEKVYKEIKENIIQSWAKVNDYISSLWMTEEEYIEKNVTPIAIKRLQAELILHKLQELEKVEVTDKELDEEIKRSMASFESPEVLKRLEELYKPGTKYYEELKSRVGYRKLIDTFFETKKK